MSQKKSPASNLLTPKALPRVKCGDILNPAKVVDMRREAYYKGTTSPNTEFIFHKKQKNLVGKQLAERDNILINPLDKSFKASKANNNATKEEPRLSLKLSEIAERYRNINNAMKGKPNFALFGRREKYVKVVQPDKVGQKSLVIPQCGGDYIDDTTRPELENEEFPDNKSISSKYRSNNEGTKGGAWRLKYDASSISSNETSLEHCERNIRGRQEVSAIDTIIRKRKEKLNDTNVSTLFGRANRASNAFKSATTQI
eukprot:TRINITY_DN2447_c0_g1_i8.p1 TRINITY_DN2447_c0_g1~~TRINITY_DN2447_c0_g1_i8.p1  ORF type:complete len:257 (-),score=58.80 TRINITY_DN2447_c0_g1_i8:153-923(-)